MKKIFKLASLLLALATIAPVFTSCGSDDDDDPTVTITINGSAIENGASVTLEKGTVSPAETGSDEVTLAISSDVEIKRVELYVNNTYEKNIAVVDTKGKLYNSKTDNASGTKSQSVTFVGVYGEYTLKVVSNDGSTSFKFKLVDSKKQADYSSATRLLCNKQTIIFDATGETSDSKIFNLTYKVDEKEDSQTLNGSFAVIDEDVYNDYSTDKMLTQFYSSAGQNEFISKRNIKVPSYYVAKSGDIYYLLKIVKMEGDILTAEVQY